MEKLLKVIGLLLLLLFAYFLNDIKTMVWAPLIK